MKKFSTLVALVMLSLFSQAKAANDDFPIMISAVGDIMMGTNYPSNNLPTADGQNIFKQSASYIKSADIRFGNFEGTLFDGDKPADGKAGGANRWLFRTPTRYVRNLTDAGFNVVSLANNHAKDFGQSGMVSTKKTLASAHIQYSSKDGEVASFDIRGTQVALIAADFYPGSRSIVNSGPLLKEIAQLKKKYSVVIVSAHVGKEGAGANRILRGDEIFLGENRGNSWAFAHDAIDAGADLILMHGPHVPRGMEVYKERLISYSLGNFATGGGISIEGTNGLAPLVRIQIDTQGRFLGGHLASFKQSRTYGTIYDPAAKVLANISELTRLDFVDSKLSFQADGFFNSRP